MKRILISLLLFYFIHGCANIQSPPGGPGDTIAPYIMISEPINNTVNFNGETVEIKFDGYMNRSSVMENIQITPDIDRDYDWYATDLEINFTEELEENTTYAIYLGGTYTDLNGNSPDKSYSIVFSTGNILDSGKISGKLYGEEVKGKYIFLYNITEKDFPDPSVEKPDYIVQTGNSGEFEIVALKNGIYRIFGVEDKLKNKLYDRNQDGYGTYISDIDISDTLKEIKGIDIYMREALDETGPQLISAQSVNSKIINFEFDENINLQTLNEANIRLIDTTGKEYNIERVLKIADNTAEFSFVVSEKIEKNLKAELFIESVADSSGNVITDTTNSTKLFLDTLQIREDLKFSVINIKDSLTEVSTLQRNKDEKPVYYFKLSNSTNIKATNYSGYLVSETDSISIILESDDLKNYNIFFENELMENTYYEAILNFRNVNDLWGNKLSDTTFSFSFETGFSIKTSMISGELINKYNCEGEPILKIVSVDSDFEKIIGVDKDGKWSIDSIPAGKYIYEVFCDENGDKEYNFGSINPFEFREYYIKTKEYQIQGNWEYKDVIITFDE